MKRICQKEGCNIELSQSDLDVCWGRHCYVVCEKHEKGLLQAQSDYINNAKDGMEEKK